jgi:hypothetical protein
LLVWGRKVHGISEDTTPTILEKEERVDFGEREKRERRKRRESIICLIEQSEQYYQERRGQVYYLRLEKVARENEGIIPKLIAWLWYRWQFERWLGNKPLWDFFFFFDTQETVLKQFKTP